MHCRAIKENVSVYRCTCWRFATTLEADKTSSFVQTNDLWRESVDIFKINAPWFWFPVRLRASTMQLSSIVWQEGTQKTTLLSSAPWVKWNHLFDLADGSSPVTPLPFSSKIALFPPSKEPCDTRDIPLLHNSHTSRQKTSDAGWHFSFYY